MKRTILLLLLTATTLAATAQTLQPWNLNLPAGQAYNVTNTVESSIDQQVMGQKMSIANTAVTQMVFAVRSAGPDGFQVEQTTSGIKLDTKVMGQTTSFDSSNPGDMEGPVGAQLKDMIGSSIEALIAPNGTISSWKGIEMPEGFSMGAGMNDSASLATYFVNPPAKPIQPGDTWTETAEQESMNTQITYTYRKSEKGQAHLDYEMTSAVAQTITNNGMEVNSNIQTKGTGTLVLELATGLVLERRYEGTLSGTSKAMGMEIPQEGALKTVTILTKK